LIKTGTARIFGRGNNRITFVSVYDGARFVGLAVADPRLRGVCVDVDGPENLSMRQLVQTFAAVTGQTSTMLAVPLPMMRLLSVLLQPIHPMLARRIQVGVVMDTHPMMFDPAETLRRYPEIQLTYLAGAVKRDYGNRG
jgi:uncharacterized protein YbjT (DUF2867 family)